MMPLNIIVAEKALAMTVHHGIPNAFMKSALLDILLFMIVHVYGRH
jgi:hypothetical protein